jgi:ABC-type uncharacterized transport system ATPase subunit
MEPIELVVDEDALQIQNLLKKFGEKVVVDELSMTLFKD